MIVWRLVASQSFSCLRVHLLAVGIAQFAKENVLDLNCYGKNAYSIHAHLSKYRNNNAQRGSMNKYRIYCRVWKTSRSNSHSSPWDEASLSFFFSLWEWQTWFSDGRGVCLPLYICVCSSALLIAEYLYPTCLPLLASVSLSLPLLVSFQCVLTRSLCVCVILLRAQDAAAEACWQESGRWCQLPRQESDLSPKWIPIWYWFQNPFEPIYLLQLHTWCTIPARFSPLFTSWAEKKKQKGSLVNWIFNRFKYKGKIKKIWQI